MKTIQIRQDTIAADAIAAITMNEPKRMTVNVYLRGSSEYFCYDCATRKEAKRLLKNAVADWLKALSIFPEYKRSPEFSRAIARVLGQNSRTGKKSFLLIPR
jgi:hypothetical protein